MGTGRLQQLGGRGAHSPAQHKAGSTWEGASLQPASRLQVPWPTFGAGGSRHIGLLPYCCPWTSRYGWVQREVCIKVEPKMDRQSQHDFLGCVLLIQYESTNFLPGQTHGLWVLVALLYQHLSLVEETS